MQETDYRTAPPGFTPQQREHFDREGYLVIENALSEKEIEGYLEVIDRCAGADPKFKPDAFYSRENIVELDPVFSALIDHPRHVGYVYDFYGELLKLHLSQFFIRPQGGWYNLWHPDGARAVPYSVYCPTLPM